MRGCVCGSGFVVGRHRKCPCFLDCIGVSIPPSSLSPRSLRRCHHPPAPPSPPPSGRAQVGTWLEPVPHCATAPAAGRSRRAAGHDHRGRRRRGAKSSRPDGSVGAAAASLAIVGRRTEGDHPAMPGLPLPLRQRQHGHPPARVPQPSTGPPQPACHLSLPPPRHRASAPPRLLPRRRTSPCRRRGGQSRPRR